MCKITESLGRMEAAKSIGNKIEWNEFKKLVMLNAELNAVELKKYNSLLMSRFDLLKKEKNVLKQSVRYYKKESKHYKQRYKDEKQTNLILRSRAAINK